MKTTLFTATAMTLTFLAGAASADAFAFNAGIEYQVEAETTEMTLGADYLTNGFTISPVLNASYDSNDLDFTGADLTVSYGFGLVGVGTDAYITIAADADFDYTETTVGLSFAF
jgi:hypothetical protein